MLKFINENRDWIFSGVGVTVLGFFLSVILNRNNKKNTEGKSSIKNVESPRNQNINTINVTTGVYHEKKIDRIHGNKRIKSKAGLNILFIDDDLKFKVVDILKQSGWINTKRVKDIVDLDDVDAKDADVIFVDINGVGKKLFQDEGLGLAYALKQKYSEKKIILYSAESNGDRFHKAFRVIDDCLSKNAEPYEFINILETVLAEL